MIPQIIFFKFDDNYLEQINQLKAQGFEFVTITRRDKRGFERAFEIWKPGNAPPRHDRLQGAP